MGLAQKAELFGGLVRLFDDSEALLRGSLQNLRAPAHFFELTAKAEVGRIGRLHLPPKILQTCVARLDLGA